MSEKNYDTTISLPDIPDFGIEFLEVCMNPDEVTITCTVNGELKHTKYLGASDSITAIVGAAVALGVVIENDRYMKVRKEKGLVEDGGGAE
jgi:hypothetical protein